MSLQIQSSRIGGVGQAAEKSATAIENKGRFLDSAAARRVIGGLGDRAPVYSASSTASRSASLDRSITASRFAS